MYTGEREREYCRASQYTLTLRDKENIAVQFVAVTVDMRGCYFHCQVTLEGNSVMDLYQFFFLFNAVEEQLLFLLSHNVTRVKYI